MTRLKQVPWGRNPGREEARGVVVRLRYAALVMLPVSCGR